MIIDLQKFIASRESSWKRLESLIDEYEENHGKGWGLTELESLYGLYRKACSDLAQAQTFATDPAFLAYLENLVSRAYGQIYRRRAKAHWRSWFSWLWTGFPMAFRRRFGFFVASVAITFAGAALGAFLVANEPAAKQAIFGDFGHLMGSPSERVAREEAQDPADRPGYEAQFSSQLMTHNIRVSLFALSLGLLWGVGTVAVLFYNGAVLGGVCYDYIAAGEGEFLAGWLLPHGVIEIPAILIAGQAGLMLAKAMLGWDSDLALGERIRAIRSDLVCLIGGIAIMLVWAGIVESYLSQTHEPTIAYSSKIAFGLFELLLLVGFLAIAGRTKSTVAEPSGRRQLA